MGEIAADQNNNQFIITTHSPVLLDPSQANSIGRLRVSA
jgi:predicted ATPase